MPPMATTEPPAALSIGHASRHSRTCAKNFSAKPASQSASVCSKKPPRREAPALLTRMSRRPKRASAKSARPFGASASRRSAMWISASASERPRGVRDLGQRLAVARSDQNVAAQRRKLQRDGLADAAARAGDERDLAFEFKAHAALPARLTRSPVGAGLVSDQASISRAIRSTIARSTAPASGRRHRLRISCRVGAAVVQLGPLDAFVEAEPVLPRDQRAHADAVRKAHVGALPLLLDQHGVAQAGLRAVRSPAAARRRACR